VEIAHRRHQGSQPALVQAAFEEGAGDFSQGDSFRSEGITTEAVIAVASAR
jgi:hypothetical protein